MLSFEIARVTFYTHGNRAHLAANGTPSLSFMSGSSILKIARKTKWQIKSEKHLRSLLAKVERGNSYAHGGEISTPPGSDRRLRPVGRNSPPQPTPPWTI